MLKYLFYISFRKLYLNYFHELEHKLLNVYSIDINIIYITEFYLRNSFCRIFVNLLNTKLYIHINDMFYLDSEINHYASE